MISSTLPYNTDPLVRRPLIMIPPGGAVWNWQVSLERIITQPLTQIQPFSLQSSSLFPHLPYCSLFSVPLVATRLSPTTQRECISHCWGGRTSTPRLRKITLLDTMHRARWQKEYVGKNLHWNGIQHIRESELLLKCETEYYKMNNNNLEIQTVHDKYEYGNPNKTR